MNEDLKIIIKAVTDEAEKGIATVKKELAGIDKEAKKASKTIDVSFKQISKAAMATVAAVTAVTTALVALGKQSLEFQKQQAKLNAAFESAGSNAKQAGETYKGLFRFLGDADRATEAAQSLARITTNTKDLAEWTEILQGVYARAGNAIPVEALAEAANETVKVGKVTGAVADALNWLGVSEDAFNEKLATATSYQEREVMLRSTLNALYGNAAGIYEKNNQALIRYNESQYNLDMAMATTAKYTTPLMTALNNLAATFLTAFAPAIRTVALYLTAFIQLISDAIEWVGSFFGMFGANTEKNTADVEGYTSAMNNYLGSLQSGFDGTTQGAEQATKAIDKLKRHTMGFDELNVVQSPVSTGSSAAGGVGGGSGGTGAIPSIPSPSDYGLDASVFDNWDAEIDSAKEKLKGVAVLVAAIAATFALWKLTDFIANVSAAHKILKTMGALAGESYFHQMMAAEKARIYLDEVKAKAAKVGGIAMIIAGAMLTIYGYSDAWANGVDWGNLATTLAGIGLIIGGLVLAWGGLAGAIGAMVGGVALVILGIKDLITNGYSMESVITITVGALLILVGVIWAFNAALFASPITWIIAAIIALVAVFVILWNECEGFRNFWIGLWEKAKVLFEKFVASIQPLIDAIIGAFQAGWELLQVIFNNYIVPLFKGAWETIKVVWEVVAPFFQNIWERIKLVFSIVKDVLGGYFRAAWEGIKFVWDTVIAYFTMIFNNIKAIFSVIKSVLTGDFQGAWDGIKQIFSNVGEFFSGIVNRIKSLFSNVANIVGDTISSVVKKAINGVLSTAVKIINGFIGAINVAISVINAIPGVSITKLSKLEVPKLAKGGIVDRATLSVIGEAGKEAVLPLENNTGWMDALADKLAQRTSTPSKIVLMVDDRELGYATINSINGITKQTGKLQLAF